MSRTDKTAPARIQREDGREGYFGAGEPNMGGVWDGSKELRKQHNRRDRQRARAKLIKGNEPDPAQPRGRAKWDFY